MSSVMSLDEVQVHLRDVITRLNAGDEVAITEAGQVVARIVGTRSLGQSRPGPGLCKGMITIVADDDDHLADFAEYLP